MHVQKDDKLGMNFTVGGTGDPEIYLTENKTMGFLAEISSGVAVPKMTSAIQAWKKATSGGMTFNDEISLNAAKLELTRSKSKVYRTRTWFLQKKIMSKFLF